MASAAGSWSYGVMKIRIGVGLGPAAVPAGFADAVRQLEAAGVDSLWLSEMVYGPLVEPLAGMAYALGLTSALKVGTGVAVLPGRHPVLVAKELTSLAGLAPGRVLTVFGLRPARPAEIAAFPVPPGRRAAVFDESLELLRLLVTGQPVTFAGEFFTVEGASVGPPPARPLHIWLGGSAPAALRRVGRYGDGWLGSFMSPAEAGQAREAIEQAAGEAGREIEADHFGLSLAVGSGGLPPELLRAIADRRPGADPASLAAGSWAEARALIGGYVEAGLSKFVVRPAGRDWPIAAFIDEFCTELLPLEN
jgi:probable F420-dependent oxidoreductase